MPFNFDTPFQALLAEDVSSELLFSSRFYTSLTFPALYGSCLEIINLLPLSPSSPVISRSLSTLSLSLAAEIATKLTRAFIFFNCFLRLLRWANWI